MMAQRGLTFALCFSLVALSACAGGGSDTNSLLPTGNTTGSTLACPSSGTLPASVAAPRSEAAGRVVAPSVRSAFVPGQIAVTIRRASGLARAQALTTLVAGDRALDLNFDATGVLTRVIDVAPGTEEAAMARLRGQRDVVSVSRIGYRSRLSVTPNDPYYTGFTGTTAPYYESSTIPGQWDMHAINVAGAWNQLAVAGSTVVGAAAPIAIVDTGVDVTHPELSGGKIVRTRCFVSYPAGAGQTTSQYVTDTDGHGTNVAGIASADSGNGLGFAGASYDAKLMAYRIFPTDPSTGCEGANSSNPQCQTNTADEASAIRDAVANGAKVISLSLGSDPGAAPCSPADPEYQAVEYAIAHKVTVVAASGNGDTAGNAEAHLDCPAGDPGVIAVGASGLNDSNPLLISEVLASYSNYIMTTGQGAGGAYLLAPGGNASGSGDSDSLHWIENIYSSSAKDASTYCKPDFGAAAGSPIDCRVEIEGTSQATPHVAAVAAMILAARPGYSPGQVATALCSSADSINDLKQGCGRVNASAAVSYALAH